MNTIFNLKCKCPPTPRFFLFFYFIFLRIKPNLSKACSIDWLKLLFLAEIRIVLIYAASRQRHTFCRLVIRCQPTIRVNVKVSIAMSFWKKYTSGPRYWNVPVLVNTGTFLVYQYCLKMWYLRSLERAGVIQKLTILECKNGLVLPNTRVPVSGTWSLLFPSFFLIHHATIIVEQVNVSWYESELWTIPEIRCTPPKEDTGIPKILPKFFIGNSPKIKHFSGFWSQG